MNRYRFTATFFVLFILLLGLREGSTQPSSQLKEYLWQKDINQLMRQFADEEILLNDIGDYQKRLQARSYIEKPGLRVQVFAGITKQNAQEMAEQLRQLNLDSVYVVESSGLYKVQIGNFVERINAEKMLDYLRFEGIDNAWIVKTQIHFPKSELEKTTQPARQQPESMDDEIIYAIQLFVTNDRGKAKSLAQEYSAAFKEDARVIRRNDFFKILLGRFKNEEKARLRLARIKQSGYTDAWITQVDE